MVRTKQTARRNPDTARPLAQGDIAVFEENSEPEHLFNPRAVALAPNMFSCRQCDRQFPTNTAREKHEKEVHPSMSFKYPCPTCGPTKCYVRRCDLREHFRAQHAEEDINIIDDVDPIPVMKESVKRARSETPDTAQQDSPAKKRGKGSTSRASNAAGSTNTSTPSAVPSPMISQGIEAVAPGATNRLSRISETITINREYYFE